MAPVSSSITAFEIEALNRKRTMLRSAFGPVIAAALQEPQVIEVMVNPDGRLWLDRLDQGRIATDTRLQWSEVERIIRLVASHIRLEVHELSPIVSAELPETGERFEGLMPPVASAPCFSIRKPACIVHRLTDYVSDGIINDQAATLLKELVQSRQNIIVVGGTVRARQLWSMLCWPKLPRATNVLSFLKTHASSIVRLKIVFHSAPSPAS